MSKNDVDQLRKRLGEVASQLQDTGSEDFATKQRLNLEADRIREELAALSDEESEKIQKNWANLSGRKGAHTQDPSFPPVRSAAPECNHTDGTAKGEYVTAFA